MAFWLLYPFSLLYGWATSVRNRLYDSGQKPSVSFDLPVINVGNLTVGGTGKTPHIEYLLRLLSPHYAIATLSRGYGRKTRGFLIADEHSTPDQIGDEPYQLYRNFGKQVLVAVGEERILAVPAILDERPNTQLILLDDAFQHRKIRPTLNILLTDHARLFFQDFLLPAGRLREARSGAQRADAVVVTKCPSSLSNGDKEAIRQQVAQYAGASTPVFFSSITYGKPLKLADRQPWEGQIPTLILVTGIATPQYLAHYLRQYHHIAEHLAFPDHHAYTPNSLQQIRDTLRKHPEAGMILTTEKDAVKLASPAWMEILHDLPICYLPIEISFGEEQPLFDRLIVDSIKQTLQEP